MKTFAQAAIIFLLVVVAVFVSFNLITGSITDNETENTLSQSVEQALYNTMSSHSYSIENQEEFLSDFMINLISQTKSKSELDLRILEVDKEEGLLDIEVRESITYPDGKVREVSCRKTVIFEEEA